MVQALDERTAKRAARTDARVHRRRRQILDAATEVMSRSGFHATAMQAVAERAGISVGLIYQYFGNKDDLLLAVIVDILEDFRDQVPAAIDAAGDDPIERFTATSVVTRTGEHPIDLLVLATGFDAISGSMLRLNPKGRGGLSLKDRWTDRFHNYIGLSLAGFPNLFMIHGPGSPGVFYNMPLGAERQINWIADFVQFMREQRVGAAEPRPDCEAAWGAEVSAIADATLFPRTDSWWTGANIPGKPRQFSAYLGGTLYYERLADASAKDYEEFVFEPALRAEGAEAP